MKKTILATSVALAITAASVSTYADEAYLEQEDTGEITTLKHGVTFGAASIIGGLLAGPIGAMFGGIGGAVLGEELSKADKYDVSVKNTEIIEGDLLDAQVEIATLKERLQAVREQSQQLNEVAMTNLEFQLLFHTGNDDLSPHTEKRLDELATFLKRNSELTVRLHGYADPRGTDEYNNVLSMYRAINVQQGLEYRGINPDRIERRYYGADQSNSPKGDLDAYALDRRVTVEVFDRRKGVAVID